MSGMEPETKDSQALMLFLRHYLSLAEVGVDVSALEHLESELGKVANLTPEDFSVVSEDWKESGKVPFDRAISGEPDGRGKTARALNRNGHQILQNDSNSAAQVTALRTAFRSI